MSETYANNKNKNNSEVPMKEYEIVIAMITIVIW